ncbi:hypothetical protein F0344_09700 [Streptomyces finlayi]|uniref:Uncharacterized protein n=1 Tax=Streptomyces finlayi TaxID=67296 RepID=A0A7G7BHN6_9ACTN|nr:hypothetical protein [Streptomyces finlayi]QNE74851.1 hypothetical protein F0344_09700 [Streptomyces finlayi]
MKATAIEGLTGTDQQLRDVVGDIGWIGFGPLGQASSADEEAGSAYADATTARTNGLNAAKRPCRESAWPSDDMQFQAPVFGEGVSTFTLVTQKELAGCGPYPSREGYGPHPYLAAPERVRAG